ncbi:MAG: RNA 2'-phosphotransferase [Acidobacteria bacterium]|nr:RNA 2'-phosphotransferase [Acidobacteriota bacterium]
MEEKQLVRISKFLSKYLRHEPESLGLSLALGGWVMVDDLLAACKKKSFPITREQLEEVVEKNSKKRFSFDPTGTQIRANQGHSVEIDLQLEPKIPPPTLYHGTAEKNLESIKSIGLQKMSRHHVHLSKDISTANNVGTRHGKPLVFAVDTSAMQKAGHTFYCSDNGVWLTDNVPPQYLKKI